MIKHMRIDSRLIHGQVAAAWMNHIGAKEIIVCNDDVAQDRIQKMALPLAARGTPVKVFSIQETIDYAKAHEDETLFVICKFPTDALALVDAGLDIKEFNVGTAAPRQGTDYKMITKTIAATKEDAQVYQKLCDHFGKVTSRITPANEEVDVMEGLRKEGLL